MRAAAVLLSLSLAAVAGRASAQQHLPIIPRTDAERARIEAVTTPTEDFAAPEKYEERPGGAATSMKRPNRDAFSQSSANMPFERELDFKVGNGLFKKIWVSAPASTKASDGLGPLYNARACQRCHLKDGRGHPPETAEDSRVSMFLRLSVPADPADLKRAMEDYVFATEPDPVYGAQLQDFALPGHKPEGRLDVTYQEIAIKLADGEVVSLRKPTYSIGDPQYGPPDPHLLLSPRVAPTMLGLGLLEAIPETDILAHADPEDADGDGISGRPNRVWSPEIGAEALGRFGLKAGAATVADQSAAAFSGDMGLSSPLHPDGWGECTEAEADCRAAPDGGSPQHDGLEVGREAMDLVTFYARNLAPPARRDVGDPTVLRGKEIFYQSGCARCHTPKFVTHRLDGQPEQSFQLIWPYSDLLLHDMGEDLADGRPEAQASGREWRTAPLWGIGLTETVSGRSSYLHDGRARSLLEAILWHGGEAEPAREAVVGLPKEDREALLAFLGSL